MSCRNSLHLKGKTGKAADEWFYRKDTDFFTAGLIALEHRWSKCIAMEGNYIEKEEVDLNPKYVRFVIY